MRYTIRSHRRTKRAIAGLPRGARKKIVSRLAMIAEDRARGVHSPHVHGVLRSELHFTVIEAEGKTYFASFEYRDDKREVFVTNTGDYDEFYKHYLDRTFRSRLRE